ncbi:MAG: GNAT family N-acetyltransferase [Victivallales bacterium]|nr:GNAT family N-acetyltransferase [Victivallales bacterium]
MHDEIEIRAERPEERLATESLVREAFWNVYRPGCLEHFVLHEFRSRPEFCPALNLLLIRHGEIIGQAMYVKNVLRTSSQEELPILTLGPICIHPAHQRKGFGKLLLDQSLVLAAETEAVGVFLEGNVGFYGKSGFVVASTMGVHYMDEPADEPVPYFLGKELKEGVLQGLPMQYRVPEGYFVDEKLAEEFDRQFPPKERLRLPGQLFSGA